MEVEGGKVGEGGGRNLEGYNTYLLVSPCFAGGFRKPSRGSTGSSLFQRRQWTQSRLQPPGLPNHTVSKFPGIFRTELHLDEKPKKDGYRKDMDLPKYLQAVKTETIRKKAKYYKTS